jgi:hypothetical protein
METNQSIRFRRGSWFVLLCGKWNQHNRFVPPWWRTKAAKRLLIGFCAASLGIAECEQFSHTSHLILHMYELAPKKYQSESPGNRKPKNLHRTRPPFVPPSLPTSTTMTVGHTTFSYLVLCESMGSLLHYFELVMRGGLDDVSKKEKEVEGGSRWGSRGPTGEKCPLSFAKRVIFVDGPREVGFCRVYFLPVARAVGSTRE